jgi:hypothetical protein
VLAGSSRDKRLDPFALPVHFSVLDKTADERVRFVELSRDQVVLRRAIHGIKMVLQLRIATYLGVAIRMEPPGDETTGAVSIVLEHPDPDLSLPLHRAPDGGGVAADWQAWARVLQLPLLVTEPDGRLREPFERIGRVRVGASMPRRRRRTAVRRRRPSILLRRKPGRRAAKAIVYRNAREIIAPN